MIFFHDKHWYRSEPLFSVEEADEDEEEDEEDEDDHHSKHEPVDPASTETSEQAPQQTNKKVEYEFLLFNYLLRFVHREGQIGDFARAGLLFLMDVAMSPGEPAHPLAGEGTFQQQANPAPERQKDPVTDAALALAEYILDGDFSEVLGAGLGAVYSQLPYKLVVASKDQGTADNMVLGGSAQSRNTDKDVVDSEDSSSQDFRSRLDHFLRLLEFIQDVLRRNVVHEAGLDASVLVGTAIVQSILDAVRRIFLENVLYPSILECSDIDGSAVAVMSYVEAMIRNMEDGQLAETLISFLMTEDDEEMKPRQRHHSMVDLVPQTPAPPPQTDRQKKLHRRKSSAMLLLEMEAPESNKQTEYFTAVARFTLKDLLSTNLKSNSPPAATAAVNLLCCLLQKHPQLAASGLLAVIPDRHATAFPHPTLLAEFKLSSAPALASNGDDSEEFIYPTAFPTEDTPITSTLFHQPVTTYSTHERELSLYLALVSRVDPAHKSEAFSTGFENYLNDALFSIQSQSAYILGSAADFSAELRESPYSNNKHRLNNRDPLLSLVLASLRNFFANTPEYNVALTGLLATLSIHPQRSLAGWLTFNHPDDVDAETSATQAPHYGVDDGDDRSIDCNVGESMLSDPLPASRLDENSRPMVHAILHGLVAQLEKYRQMVDEFDTYLLERRRGLLFNENLTDALSLAIDINEDFGSSIPRTEVRPATPEAKPKPKSRPSFMQSLLTPKKKASAATPQTPPRPNSTPNQSGDRAISASPFGNHYERTEAIVVEPFVVPETKQGSYHTGSWAVDEEDVFSSGWGTRQRADDEAKEPEEETKGKKEVTLSRLLDNVVILEESIKELASIIHTRRSLGIDSIRYL